MKISNILTSAFIGLASVAYADSCNIALAVLPVQDGEDVPVASSNFLESALSNMVTASGITADPAQGQFFISGRFNHLTEDVTPGPPMQTAIHTYLTLYIGDLSSKSVYASTTLELRGVGDSKQRAFINAMRSLNANNSKVANFIDKGRNKVVDYFNQNYPSIIQKAKRAAAQNHFDEALWYLTSIPECCVGYNEAYNLENSFFQQYIDRQGVQLYNKALALWSADPSAEGAAKAFAFLQQIDPDSSEYSKAQALAKEMKDSVKSDYTFELREKYHDQIDIQKARINAIREVGVAYGRGQQPTTTNLMWLR